MFVNINVLLIESVVSVRDHAGVSARSARTPRSMFARMTSAPTPMCSPQLTIQPMPQGSSVVMTVAREDVTGPTIGVAMESLDVWRTETVPMASIVRLTMAKIRYVIL